MAFASLSALTFLPLHQMASAGGGIAKTRDQSTSAIDLMLHADPVVQAVMATLALASIWSWAVAIDKWFTVQAASGRAKRFESQFWSGGPLEDMSERVTEKTSDAMARIFVAGSREYRDAARARTALTEPQANAIIERARAQMNVAVQRESTRLESGLQTLAIVASAAPFVGLFGTVIGIMNAFSAIGAQQQTNLAVVGPGIAEALLATALGLGAAVPALVFYNKFSGDIGKFTERLDLFAQAFAIRHSRRLSGGRED